ncbi:nitrilase-related carbon-nitrogen hydrolase [Nocardia seriolae]|uniref:Aliphatic nitrilase n=1 Tax=Nocardia seriolae TaxID=37332 RepID=A0ABC8B5X4_9NOCA|nr:nitrilase-related carbon-nitrogen hydrolase [Nocardia seriolae]APB01510.1 Aliphatic nitrilase [Nocardia seriolae]MTJ61005.1 carbon-nitrogen hydrolase family protein [Nocardia seriolae]MTJ70533.1 carbon-nitrogen hydrolase family protein [Nocardia seriolae]MTJ90862.1 carbon-nitrogen hydrolase family protein [Nocardia seriolae]MTK34819.1 carbon-nitrogen hydrolase family protein [Nocardia seriolae]
MRITVRVAAVQAEPSWLRLSDGVEQVVELIGAAAMRGARLIAFPEAFLPGYPWWRWIDTNQWNVEYSTRCRENSMTRDGAEMRAITDAAAAHGIHVVLGFGERQDRRIYLSQAVIDDSGELLSVRRKAGLNSVERKIFASGTPNLPAVHRTPIGMYGALSGQENQRPLLTRALRADEEQIHVAAWPAGPDGDAPGPDSAVTVSRMYALEVGAFVLAPAAVVTAAAWGGAPQPRTTGPTGRARIYAPDGSELVSALPEGERGILYADLEIGASAADSQPCESPRVTRDRKEPAVTRRNSRRAATGWQSGPDRWALPMTLGAYPGGIAAC